MFTLNKKSVEWALQHLCLHSDSDCFPKVEEFHALRSDWEAVRSHILSLDLFEHTPKSPVIHLAPKPNGLYRIVQRLSPIDAVIYTALVHEVHEHIEAYRIPSSEGIACSYRISPDMEGSFFDKNETGWDIFSERTAALAKEFSNGYVLVTDITDFYNQIYAHRVRGVIAEAGGGELDEHSQVIEQFLMGLYTKTSRGIPIGPAASIIISEAILGDIDSKILSYTRSFVRWVDDARIFFHTKAEAQRVLHDLTDYLYRSHRLVFSGEKTRIMSTEEFLSTCIDEKAEEDSALFRTGEEMALRKVMDDALEDASPYADPELVVEAATADTEKIYAEMAALPEFEVTSQAYMEWMEGELKKDKLDFAILRRLYRRATTLRIRSILTYTLENFEKMLPIVREVSIYLKRVFNEDAAIHHKDALSNIWGSDYAQMPYVNNWLCYVLQKPCFNGVDLPIDYEHILTVRNAALIACRKNDTAWVKSHRDGIDTLPDWDKRGVLLATSILSKDEMTHIVDIEAKRGGIEERAIAQHLKSKR